VEVSGEMKIQVFQKQLEVFNEQEINEYNLGYGRLFRWMYLSVRCRIQDVTSRREIQEESK
jgi:hypothetical protein